MGIFLKGVIIVLLKPLIGEKKILYISDIDAILLKDFTPSLITFFLRHLDGWSNHKFLDERLMSKFPKSVKHCIIKGGYSAIDDM